MSAALTAWLTSHMRAGELGIFGDFLYGINETRYGDGPVETLSGPTLLPLLNLGIVHPLDAIKKRMEGKDSHFLAHEFRELKSFIPAGNVWYAKAAMEHLVFQRIMEAMSPGYLNVIRSHTARVTGQDWWWRPGETAPDRAPDVGAAVKGR